MNAAARPDPANEAGVAVLAAAPLLASTTGLLSALALCALFAALICASVVSVSWCRWIMPSRARIALILLITTTWVCIAEMLMSAFFYELRMQFGIYVSVLSVNAMLNMQLEERALAEGTGAALRAAAGAGLYSGALVCTVAALRDLLATGSLFSDGTWFGEIPRVQFMPGGISALLAGGGALLLMGLTVAAFNAFMHRHLPQPD
jgi:H+/Na+-translocating ferredoxin:NAD+ oxidoreductase subunit E